MPLSHTIEKAPDVATFTGKKIGQRLSKYRETFSVQKITAFSLLCKDDSLKLFLGDDFMIRRIYAVKLKQVRAAIREQKALVKAMTNVLASDF